MRTPPPFLQALKRAYWNVFDCTLVVTSDTSRSILMGKPSKWAKFSLYTNWWRIALYIPGALFAILLKQVVKTSYKCCIGSSSLAAILGTTTNSTLLTTWQDNHQRQPIASKLSKTTAGFLNLHVDRLFCFFFNAILLSNNPYQIYDVMTSSDNTKLKEVIWITCQVWSNLLILPIKQMYLVKKTELVNY